MHHGDASLAVGLFAPRLYQGEGLRWPGAVTVPAPHQAGALFVSVGLPRPRANQGSGLFCFGAAGAPAALG